MTRSGSSSLACGTGKAMTALWREERLDARHVLVLAPSLALLRTVHRLNVWRREHRGASNEVAAPSREAATHAKNRYTYTSAHSATATPRNRAEAACNKLSLK